MRPPLSTVANSTRDCASSALRPVNISMIHIVFSVSRYRDWIPRCNVRIIDQSSNTCCMSATEPLSGLFPPISNPPWLVMRIAWCHD